MRTARIMGDNTTFVLANSGHLQSLVNPPTNKKALVFGDRAGQSGRPGRCAMSSADKHQGSWWLNWRDWLHARSDAARSKRRHRSGNARFPVITEAPGTYVFEQ